MHRDCVLHAAMGVPDTDTGGPCAPTSSRGLPALHADCAAALGVSDPLLTLEANSQVGEQLLIKVAEARKAICGAQQRARNRPGRWKACSKGWKHLSPLAHPTNVMSKKKKKSTSS